MDLSETFILFCENAAITIEETVSVQCGTKYKVSRQGEEAYMTLYNNGTVCLKEDAAAHSLLYFKYGQM